MTSSLPLRERLYQARALLTDLAPAEARVVAPALAQIERALTLLETTEGDSAVSSETVPLCGPTARPYDELDRLTPSITEGVQRTGLVDAILNQSPHGILIADADGRLILQNPAALRIWAGSAAADDVDGWGKYRAFHSDGRPFEAHDWAMAQSLANGTVNEAREIHFLRFDGTHGHMIGSSAPIFGAQNRVIGAVSVFADITRLKQVEETLQVTEQQLSTVLRSIGDAVIATNASGQVTFMNVVAESLTGWHTAEARGVHFDRVLRLLDEVTGLPAESPYARVSREGRATGLSKHTVLVRRDGTELAIDESTAPIRGSKGEFAGVVVVFRDITEKRREEERRAFLGDIGQQLLETSLDYEVRLARVAELAVPRLADWAAIDMLAEDGSIRRLAVAHIDPRKIAFVDEVGRRYPTDRQASMGVPHILRTGESEIVTEITEDLLVATARSPEHLRLIREIGLRSYMGVPLTVQGRTLGVITFATAETNRLFGPDDLDFAQEIARRAAAPVDNARLYAEAKRARAQAEAAELRFRSLVDAIPQIVWSANAQGEHDYLSPRWNDYTGQGPDERMADRSLKAIHPEDYAECYQRWTEATEKRVPWQVEYRLLRADGVYRWHLGRSVPIIEDGRIVKWYGTATDIDDQKRAVRTRDDILATVSHDLRNPLGNILLSADLLDQVRSEEAILVETIKRAANQMSMLIRDLLDITAVEGGELSVNRRPVQIGPLVTEAISQQFALARQKDITLLLVPGGGDIVAFCDRDRILQVFANLLGNALKFTPECGVITVYRALDGDEVRITVTDTGPGIPAEQRGRVFDRFWRDKESANAGSGLGLAICRGIIEQHGGRIWVEGCAGGGAAFAFTLPLWESAKSGSS